jgi:hypothetical protein
MLSIGWAGAPYDAHSQSCANNGNRDMSELHLKIAVSHIRGLSNADSSLVLSSSYVPILDLRNRSSIIRPRGQNTCTPGTAPAPAKPHVCCIIPLLPSSNRAAIRPGLVAIDHSQTFVNPRETLTPDSHRFATAQHLVNRSFLAFAAPRAHSVELVNLSPSHSLDLGPQISGCRESCGVSKMSQRATLVCR